VFDMEAFVADARAAQLGQAVNESRRGAPRPGRVRPPAGRPRGGRPDFRRTDLIVVNHSGGKDGLAATGQVVEQAVGQRLYGELTRDGRLVVQYNRLGERVSWPGTADMGRHAARLVELYGDRPGTEGMARQHAEHYGLRFEVTERERDGDLLDHIAQRGMFPDGGNRYCTSDHKRGPGRKLLTRLVRELGLSRPARVLYVFGFRAAESDARAKKIPFHYNESASGAGTVRQVFEWYPVHHWTEDHVWSFIHDSGIPYAWPYDAGMSRLSCRLCVLAGQKDLVLAAALSPDVADQYAAVQDANVARGEAEGDHRGRTFQAKRSMHDIIAAANHVTI
jgi:3'-phosphoadenosine 5'-phosphosulfate sulfotransferase (PAPS reductase)/FAD synthetase